MTARMLIPWLMWFVIACGCGGDGSSSGPKSVSFKKNENKSPIERDGSVDQDGAVEFDAAVDRDSALATPDGSVGTLSDGAANCSASACPALSDLVPSVSELRPAFDAQVTEYTLDLGIAPTTFTITPQATPGAVVTIASSVVDSGRASAPITSPDIGGTADVDVQVSVGTMTTNYLVHVRRIWRAELHAKASNPEIDDRFGTSVAVSGDVVVVGAPGEGSIATGVNGSETSNAAFRSGAAYVFRRTSDSWVQEAYLKASNTDVDDAFGTSVAISGDVVVVGAPQEGSKSKLVNGDDADDSLISAGAAYVFRRVAGTWEQEAYLKANNTGDGDWFGVSVAISGNRIVVGADQEDGAAMLVDGASDEGSPGSGAAYVYRYASSTWQYEAYVKASNTGDDDAFGHRVAIVGDVIAVSAPGEDSDDKLVDGGGADNLATNSGAAYIYRYAAGSWQYEAYLKASNTGADDGFGSGIALADAMVVVGADGEDSAAKTVDGDGADDSASDSGAAYVYRYAAGTWMHVAYLKPSNPGPGDRFGVSVAADSDLVAVGAHDEDGSGTGVNADVTELEIHSGAVYVFRDLGGGFAQEAYIKGPGPNLSYGRFVWSVAFSDGLLAVGARDDASGGMGIDPAPTALSLATSGALYLFE